jgi:hypothetical protein
MKAISMTLLAALMPAAAAMAAPTIDVGSHLLLPNTPHQAITIDVTGGDAVQGLNFYAQIADGTGPKIESVDLLAGTIFASNNTGQQNPESLPQTLFASTTTSAGTVAADGVLATLWIDTTGFNVGDGPWSLNLVGTDDSDTDFAGVFADVTNGMIDIQAVPEPATLGLLSIGALGLLRRRR